MKEEMKEIGALSPRDATVAELLEALEALTSTMENCSVTAGVCMCGDSMEGHANPMDCGHSPVDMGQYHADAAYKSAKDAIAKARELAPTGEANPPPQGSAP